MWKTSITVPLAKPGKEDRPDNLRYITLLNIPFKAWEAVVEERILTNTRIHQNQWGFAKTKDQ